ncbi:MAG: hypothetical protein KGJ61_09055 [Candidatus Omnitrophica bacterium]|nr:hypothetical protein [Candidatus Omnitrophota bacterium]
MGLVLKNRLNLSAFICLVLGFSCIQISYIFDGVWFLDLAGISLLVPAFLFFIAGLLGESMSASKDYCIGLTVLACAAAGMLAAKYKFEVGTLDDAYHTIKVVAFSIRNGFPSIIQIYNSHTHNDPRLCIIGFVESVWGIAWRYVHWDYIIVLIQILPVFVLWRQLVDFFTNRKTGRYAGFLSAVIILSMQIFWYQACSTMVDGITGIIAGVALLKTADLLGCPQRRGFYTIAAAAYAGALCLLPKPSLIPLAVLSLGVSLYFAFTYLGWKEKLITVLAVLPALGYFIKHYVSVRMLKGTFFYLAGVPRGIFNSAFGRGEVTGQFPIYDQKFFGHFKLFYLLSSWMTDHRYFDVGYGLLWSYLVVPILIIALITGILKLRRTRKFHPPAIIFIFLCCYYYFLDISVSPRLMLGFDIFIMAWAFDRGIGFIESSKWTVPSWLKLTGAFFMLAAALLEFYKGDGVREYQYKLVSVMEAQKQLFPKYIHAQCFQPTYCEMVLDDFKGHPLSAGESYLLAQCRQAGYRFDFINGRRLSKVDYHFGDVLKNYRTLGFRNPYYYKMKPLPDAPDLRPSVEGCFPVVTGANGHLPVIPVTIKADSGLAEMNRELMQENKNANKLNK